ncbi:MAG: PKD domain-containing protein, partial [Gemmatimonadales bacterium]
VSGYSASNKAAIVVKNGWIVGEYYNQPSAATAVYYLASNGKTFSIMLVGRMALDYPQYGFGLSSKLYDTRWLPQGFPLSDARKSAITFDLVFRHASGIVPEAEAAIASGAVRSEAGWEFVPFTVGKNAAFPVSAPLYYPPGDPAAYPKGSAYSSVAFNHFSLIFRTVTGLEPSLYLREGILDRIGVGRMAYKVTPGLGDYLWATAGNGLASARDFARIGYLMLHDGRWGSAQVLPDGWLSNFTTSPDYRNIRSNVDCRWGAKFPADMYRTTGSGLNWALMVPSLDMMLTFNGRTPKSLGAEVDTVSLQKLFAAVTERYVACDGTIVNDTPPANAPPVASFSSSCSGLVCSFTDASSDADGTVTAWQWTFGDGTSSTTRHPSHTYASAGSYTVGLTVTDDGGAKGSTGRTVAPSALALGATGRKVKGLEYVDLVWTGAASASVDIYRNGAKLVTVPNTGRHTDATGKKGGRTFTYRVCEATSTICSNTVSVAF